MAHLTVHLKRIHLFLMKFDVRYGYSCVMLTMTMKMNCGKIWILPSVNLHSFTFTCFCFWSFVCAHLHYIEYETSYGCEQCACMCFYGCGWLQQLEKNNWQPMFFGYFVTFQIFFMLLLLFMRKCERGTIIISIILYARRLSQPFM